MNKYKIKRLNKKKAFRITGIVTIAYAAGGIAMYYLQKTLLLHPRQLPPGYKFKFNFPFIEINIPFGDSDIINLVRFLPEQETPKGVVLYFHGNRDNINRYAKYAANFTRHGYEVWMNDYPGYGKSTGKFTEDNVYAQAAEIYRLARAKFASNKIIVYGKSLGSGIASWLASKKECRHVILETPYYSMSTLLTRYAPIYPARMMSHFKFPAGEYLKKVTAPVTIFHGSKDKVIPHSHASLLRHVLKEQDEFITIDNGSHNNLNDFRLFHDKLDAVLAV
jgi:alpha-beta hydrolase superfamily lysophospholipase